MWAAVENRVLSAPMRVYYSYKLIGSLLPYNLSFVSAPQVSETHRKTSGLQTNQDNSKNTIHHSRKSIINLIHNQIQCPHSISSSQVSLYGPPLNQLCQDDLPLMSNPLSTNPRSLSRASTYSTMPGRPILVQ